MNPTRQTNTGWLERFAAEVAERELKAAHLKAGRGMTALWGVYDQTGALVESFPFKDRAGADKRCAELTAASWHGSEPYYVAMYKARV